MTRCMESLNTINTAAYKKFLQAKLKSWFKIAPKARSSVAGAMDCEVDGDGVDMPPADHVRRGKSRVMYPRFIKQLPPKNRIETWPARGAARAKICFIYMIS